MFGNHIKIINVFTLMYLQSFDAEIEFISNLKPSGM